MFQVIRLMASDISGLRTKFEAHMDIEEHQRTEVMIRIQELSDKIDDAIHLKQAFPHIEGKPDVHGHRVFHDGLIEDSVKSDKLWDKVKEEVVSKAVSACVIAFVVILGLGLKDWATSFIHNAVTTTTTVTDSTSTAVEKKHE